MEDFVTWVDTSKLKRTIMQYNDEVCENLLRGVTPLLTFVSPNSSMISTFFELVWCPCKCYTRLHLPQPSRGCEQDGMSGPPPLRLDVPNEAESLLVSVFAPTFRFGVQDVYLLARMKRRLRFSKFFRVTFVASQSQSDGPQAFETKLARDLG